jgi:predicted nucleic acid-binding protein
MLVVSDTSPLNYLVLVDAIEFLPALFSEVAVPPIVLAELSHHRSPLAVRTWANAPPTWLQVRTPRKVEAIAGLHRGETEAIALVEELHADALLVDEYAAMQVATERGIAVIRTISVLAKVIALGKLDLEQTIEKLQKTNFRGPVEMVEQLVRQFHERGS